MGETRAHVKAALGPRRAYSSRRQASNTAEHSWQTIAGEPDDAVALSSVGAIGSVSSATWCGGMHVALSPASEGHAYPDFRLLLLQTSSCEPG